MALSGTDAATAFVAVGLTDFTRKFHRFLLCSPCRSNLYLVVLFDESYVNDFPVSNLTCFSPRRNSLICKNVTIHVLGMKETPACFLDVLNGRFAVERDDCKCSDSCVFLASYLNVWRKTLNFNGFKLMCPWFLRGLPIRILAIFALYSCENVHCPFIFDILTGDSWARQPRHWNIG